MANEKKKRTHSGNWVPGPGRPTKAQEFGLNALIDRAWPPEEQEKAIQRMAWLIHNADKDATKVAAFRALMEYKFGKPAQRMEIEHSGAVEVAGDVSKLSDEELQRIIEGAKKG